MIQRRSWRFQVNAGTWNILLSGLLRAYSRDVETTIYISDMFETNNDADNRATVANHVSGDLPVVGLGVYGPVKDVDKILSGTKLHQ